MPDHRIAKRPSNFLITTGTTVNTAGVVVNDQRFATTPAESKYQISLDGTNIRVIDDGHIGGAAETSTGTSYGIANQQQSAAGLGNGADATDDVLFTYALPANALITNGKAVEVEAWGTTSNSASNKIVKLWWGTTTQTVGSAVSGGTALVTSGNIGNGSSIAWYLLAQVVKTASNVQISFAAVYAGTSVAAQTVTTTLAMADNALINITLTGSDSGSNAAACKGNSFSVAFQN